MTYRLLTILFLAIAIVLSFFIWGAYGILGSCLTIFFTVPIWGSVYMNTMPLTQDIFEKDVISFWSEGFFRIITLLAFHVIIILFIGRKTLIKDLLLWYFVAAFIGYSYAYFKKKMGQVYWFGFGISPAFLSVFLMINFYISHSPIKETYRYSAPTSYIANTLETEKFIIGPRIRLKDHVYAEYPGIRSFFSRSTIKGNQVTYTFETGLFGIRVVKECSFTTIYK